MIAKITRMLLCLPLSPLPPFAISVKSVPNFRNAFIPYLTACPTGPVAAAAVSVAAAFADSFAASLANSLPVVFAASFPASAAFSAPFEAELPFL